VRLHVHLHVPVPQANEAMGLVGKGKVYVQVHVQGGGLWGLPVRLDCCTILRHVE
jgi:hypothetical protein